MKVLGPHAAPQVFRNKTTVTIGVFDGVHIGHRKLIKEARACAPASCGKSILITFETHPDIQLKKTPDIKLIKSMENKIKLIKKYGIDYMVVLDFNKIAKMTAEEFIRDFLIKKYNMGRIVAGEDFVFGRGGRGNIRTLRQLSKKYGFTVKIVKDIYVSGKKVSSTMIREYLKKGNIRMVEKMLGRPYEIESTVLKGRHIGFAFPTANMKIDYEHIPASGAWAVRVTVGGRKYLGAANIGTAPTLKNEKEQLLEVYIFNFHKNIYGKKIRVMFLEKIRNERKFKTYDGLLSRVKKDIAYIKKKYS